MNKPLLISVAVIMIAVLVLGGCGQPALTPKPSPAPSTPPAPTAKPAEKPVQTITWKRADYSGPAGVISPAMVWYADEVYKRSGGRLKIEHFWSETLSPSANIPDGLKAGLFEMAHFISSFGPSKVPLHNLASLTCLFPLKDTSKENILKLFTILDEWKQTPALQKEWADWNSMHLFSTGAWPFLIIGKARIAGMQDFKGVKIRASGGIEELLKKLGASPIMISMTELYDALSKGIVDSIVQVHSIMRANKLYEVSKYFTTNVDLQLSQPEWVVSKKAWDGLPDDLKQVLLQVAKEYPAYLTDLMQKEIVTSEALFKEKNIEFLRFSDADFVTLQEMSLDLWKAQVNKLEEKGLPGKQVFNSLQDIIKKHIPTYKQTKF